MDDLDHHLAGVTERMTFWPTALSRTWSMKDRDHLERHIGLDQRPAHLAHRRIDIVLRQAAAAGELVENS